MRFSRRELLRIAAVAGGAGGMAGCAKVAAGLAPSEPAALPSGDVEPTVRLLNRAAFGPSPGLVAEVEAKGRERFVNEQLEPDDDEGVFLRLQLGRLDVLRMDPMELRDLPEEEVVRQLQQATLLRAVYGPHQLKERLVDLWSNHFNIYARKGLGPWLKIADDLAVVRKHALGSFHDLLRATAHSPAMLAYLENDVNRKGTPNENYARELMELHTMGVHGGYTQADVQEVARCFTGWTVEKRFLRARGRFRFDPELHDDGPKVVLGQVIPPGGGKSDGDRVLEILAAHPSTARFVAAKVCRYFLGDSGSVWTDRLAEIYRETNGHIPSMIRPLLLSEELLAGPAIPKRPLDFLASSLRALGAVSDCGRGLQAHLEKMGQPLFQWPMPDGYPDRAEPWTGGLLSRWNFALALTEGRIAGTDIPALESFAEQGAMIETILGHRRPSELPRIIEGARLKGAAPGKLVALCLSSPDFQWR